MRRILPLLAVGLLACSEGTEPPTGPSTVVAQAKGGAVMKVTGSGHITTSAKRTFTFTAQEDADGNVKGQFTLVIHGDPMIRLHAEVTCMSTAGNRAWVGGRVTSASDPSFVGGETDWVVEDNGQGNPSPDLISLMANPAGTPDGWAQTRCDNQDRTPTLPVEGGNVRIH